MFAGNSIAVVIAAKKVLSPVGMQHEVEGDWYPLTKTS